MDFSLLREYEGEDARVALATVIGRVGLDSPSLREIARTAMRSPSTLLAWFGSKTELHRRALIALGVRWYHCLQQHPIPADERALEHARLRLAFEELARSDRAVAEVLDEVIRFERARLAAWVQRYTPERSWYAGEPRPLEEATVAALHAMATALWDARRFPDREAARQEFETICGLVVLGTAQLFTDASTARGDERLSGDEGPMSRAEQVSGDQPRPVPAEQLSPGGSHTCPPEQTFGSGTSAPGHGQSFDTDTAGRPGEQACSFAHAPTRAERAFSRSKTPSAVERLVDADEARRERERAFEEATRPPYTIIRPSA